MKIALISILRKLGLMHLLDKCKYQYQKIKFQNKNKQYQSKHPDIVFPPDYMMFEAYRLDYEKYIVGGRESAEYIKSKIETYVPESNLNILDWGCGPARIIRHLPDFFDNTNRFFGTDYNKNTIQWCSDNIKKITFKTNEINPPLKFEQNFFDVIYGISIFTHLSEINHQNWINELHRVTKPGGVVLITTHGAAFKMKMTNSEKKLFDNNQLVVRGNVVEGHRVYTAFQPEIYLRKLISNKFTVLNFEPGQKESWGPNQDLWVFRKV